MNVIWRKVWRDLAHNKTRTVLVVLSTAVGVLALGVVISLSEIMTEQLSSVWQVAHPAHIVLALNGTIDDDTLPVVLGTACPNILFPYAREVVSDIVTKAGFPQLVLSPVNFDMLYAQEAQRRQAAEAQAAH